MLSQLRPTDGRILPRRIASRSLEVRLVNVGRRSLSAASVGVLFSAMRMRLSAAETKVVHYRALLIRCASRAFKWCPCVRVSVCLHKN